MNIVEKGTEQMQCEPHTQHPQSNKCCLSCHVPRYEKHKNMRKKKLIQVLYVLHDSDHTQAALLF